MAAIAWLKLGAPFLAVLFSYFFLTLFRIRKRKSLAIAIFLCCVLGIFYGFGFFIGHSLATLPRVVADAVPALINFTDKWGIELPFNDLESFRSIVVQGLTAQIGRLTNFAKLATTEFVSVILGLAIAIGLFLNAKIDLDEEQHAVKNNLYSAYCREIAARFSSFYESFVMVMGAQIIISSINTAATGLFVVAIGLPYRQMIMVITFLCGLIPIVGNLISNAIIFCIAATVSVKLAFAVVVFLVVLHKTEYFLNSRIIGGRIKNPMWLILLSLIACERLMGIPGMILAPILLHYAKKELAKVPVKEAI